MRLSRLPITLAAAVLVAGGACLASPVAIAAPVPSATGSVHSASVMRIESATSKAKAWAKRHYGTFRAKTVHGTGDDVVTLPKHVKAAIVTASTTGNDNFIVETLDRKNHEQDLLVNTIGAYRGTTAFGLDTKTTARTLQVTADGAWTLKIRPVSKAGALPKSHSGDGVFLFDHAAGSLRFRNDGEGNVVVEQHSGGDWNLLVNEIGSYSGTVPFDGGPSVLTVESDGTWTAKRR